jgi:hypothetical protein
MNATEAPAAALASEEYGTEVLCASWNPAAGAVAEQPSHSAREGRVDLSAGEAESFLSLFYRAQGA